jgi:CheY-like chemotaxis protein/anti-sigma regulatory factor (Ser/Thr protein kinase)
MGKGLVMDLLISEEVPSHAMLDAPRVRQVVTNLLGNAIKFTQFGGIDLCVSGDETLRIRVSDTGIGIPEEQIDHIFEPFEQVQSGRRRLFEGTGLGLAITQQLVQAMGGTVSLKSQLGYGTDVVVQMPLARVKPADMPGCGDINAANLNLKGRRILLVEDNKTNQFVVRKMLEKREAQVRVVSNGQEALDVYDPAHFDLVLMDISMPVLTGHDACRLIRKRQAEFNWPHRPILALTGNAFETDRKEAFESGMDGFLTKPIRLDDLLKTVATHLPVQ